MDDRSLWLSVLLVACGSSAPVAETPETSSREPVAETPTSHVDRVAEPPPDPVAMLLADVESVPPTPWPALADATANCPPPRGRSEDALGEWLESCDLPSMAAWDAAAQRWVVLDVDRGEGGIERVSAVAATTTGDETLLGDEVAPALIARLRTLLRRQRVEAAPNLVVGIARRESSLVSYGALVTLGAPLEGTHLWIETSTDLDRPEHVLFRGDGSARAEIGRRPAALGPCDGDGWTCEAEPDGDDCTPAQLRAEQRLCVLPVGIDGVAVADGTLVIVGTVAAAGHGGAPPFHWVVPFASP